MTLALAASTTPTTPPGPDDDAPLVERAQRGDAQAFRALHDRYDRKLRSFLRAQVHDPSLADDLLQETFIAAWLALPRYEQRGAPFGAWLSRIARNKAVDYYRRRRPTTSLDGVDLSGLFDSLDVEERALQHERRELLTSALGRLPYAQRRVVALRFLAERSSIEVGEVTGANPVAGSP